MLVVVGRTPGDVPWTKIQYDTLSRTQMSVEWDSCSRHTYIKSRVCLDIPTLRAVVTETRIDRAESRSAGQ